MFTSYEGNNCIMFLFLDFNKDIYFIVYYFYFKGHHHYLTIPERQTVDQGFLSLILLDIIMLSKKVGISLTSDRTSIPSHIIICALIVLFLIKAFSSSFTVWYQTLQSNKRTIYSQRIPFKFHYLPSYLLPVTCQFAFMLI